MAFSNIKQIASRDTRVRVYRTYRLSFSPVAFSPLSSFHRSERNSADTRSGHKV